MSEHPESPEASLLITPADLKKHFPHRYSDPKIAKSAFIAKGAQIMGDVSLGDESNIWFNTVLRGDVNYVRVGDRTNIQDLTMVHVSFQTQPTIIGNDVTIGHSAIIHGCRISDNVLIGMGSIILDGAEIGPYVILGAGSLVTQNTKIPPGSKAFGRPAKVVAPLTEAEKEHIRWSAQHYVSLARTYR